MLRNNFKLTIAIPTYNRCSALQENLSVIFSIIGPETEVLISDNASTDSTFNVCQNYKERSNFRYIKNNENLGYDNNVLSCASNAGGEYVWFLSDDDLITESLFLEVKEIISTGKYSGILVNGKVVSEDATSVLHESLTDVQNSHEIIATHHAFPSLFRWSTLLSAIVLKKEDIAFDVPKRSVGTMFVQLPLFWFSCFDKPIYLLVDKKLTKRDSTENNFGESTAFIWLWNMLKLSKIFVKEGVGVEVMRRCQTSIYGRGVFSGGGILAHYVLSRSSNQGYGGLDNYRDIETYVGMTQLERTFLRGLSMLPDMALGFGVKIIRLIFK